MSWGVNLPMGGLTLGGGSGQWDTSGTPMGHQRDTSGTPEGHQRAQSAVDVAVLECTADRAGDWPAGRIHRAMTAFPHEMTT